MTKRALTPEELLEAVRPNKRVLTPEELLDAIEPSQKALKLKDMNEKWVKSIQGHNPSVSMPFISDDKLERKNKKLKSKSKRCRCKKK